MQIYFGRVGWTISMLCFIVNFYVGVILFFQVLSQSLYPIILWCLNSNQAIEMTTDWSQFSLSYTCLIILGLTMLLAANKDMSIVAKINAFGVIFVVIFLLYVI